MDRLDLLLVSDDMHLRQEAIEILGGSNWTHVLTPEEAHHKTSVSDFHAMLLDVRSASGGLENALRMLTSRGVEPPVVAVVPSDQMDAAAVALEAGAFDYTLSPVQPDRLAAAVHKAAEAQALLRHVLFLDPRVIGHEEHPRPAALLKELARSEEPLLIRGEAGTGVDLVARALHFNGRRRDGPFVDVACASLPQHLLESELFGYEKGAVAGGMVYKSGQAELAAGGTLFLENIEALGLGAQMRLMKCLREGSLYPMGSETGVDWEARLVAGAEVDLAEQARARNFRDDLCESLSRTVIDIPSLRDRREDIPELVNFYLEKYRRLHKRGPIIFSETILNRLAEYPWPGNLRELEKTIERYVLSGVMPSLAAPPSEEEVMGIETPRREPKKQKKSTPLKKAARMAERDLIINTLKECGGNKRQAARQLKISYKTLFNKLHRYNIATRIEFE